MSIDVGYSPAKIWGEKRPYSWLREILTSIEDPK